MSKRVDFKVEIVCLVASLGKYAEGPVELTTHSRRSGFLLF